MAHQFPEFAAQGVGSRFLSALQLVVQAHVEELQQLRAETGELRDEAKYVSAEKKLRAVPSKLSNGKPVASPRCYQSKDSTPVLPMLCQSQDACLDDLTMTPHSASDVAPRTTRMGIADSPRPDAFGDIDLSSTGILPELRVKSCLSWQGCTVANHCSAKVKKSKSRLADMWRIRDEEDKGAETCAEQVPIEGHLSLDHYGKRLAHDQTRESMASGSSLIWMVEHSCFEMVFCILIFFNTATIALEAQYDGVDMGHKLGYVGHNSPAADAYPRAKEILHVADLFFGICFTAELLLKVFALGLRFFLETWNVFDLFIMTIWGIANFAEVDEVANPMMFRVFRLLKIMRIVRLFKSLSSVDSLLVLIKSIRACLYAFLWSSSLIILMTTFTSLVAQSLLNSYFIDEAEPIESRREVFEYFGTFSRSAASLFEATLGNFALVMRMVTVNVDEAWSIFFIVYKLIGGFAVITVISGVFLQETFKVANTDDDLMLIKQRRQVVRHIQKMSRLLKGADNEAINHHGFSWKTFHALSNDPFVKSWLAAYEFDFSDVKVVFELMDNGDGHITVDDLMAGVSRLKGGARSIDLHVMLYQVNEVKKLVGNLQKDVQDLRLLQNGK